MKFAAILFAFLSLFPLIAQDEGAPLKKALDEQKTYKTVQVDFQLNKTTPALTETLVTPGKLWLIPGRAFRWQLGSPKTKTIIYEGRSVYVLDEDEKTGERLEPDDKNIKPLLLTLGIGEEATYEGLMDRFRIAATNREGNHFVANLTPTDRRIRRTLTNLRMQVNTANSFPEEIGWTQKDGTEILTKFAQPELNKALPEGIFSFAMDDYQWK
jgi:outer membrane lipoprotein-sorting protein